MSSLVGSSFRRRPRYEINDHTGTTVTIDPGDGCTEPLNATLLDISLYGAKLETTAAITAKQSIVIRIESTFPRQTIEVDGQVTWANRLRPDAWQLGCSFASQLPADVLECYARAGVLERRQRPRSSVSLAALAKCELESDEIPISILDYSADGGFRLLSPSSVEPHRRVVLRIRSECGDVFVRGKSIWESESEAGHHIGCEFLTIEDSQRLAEVLDGTHDQPRTRTCWLRTLRQVPPINQLALLAQRRRFRNLLYCSSIACVALLLAAVLIPELALRGGGAAQLMTADGVSVDVLPGSKSRDESRKGDRSENLQSQTPPGPAVSSTDHGPPQVAGASDHVEDTSYERPTRKQPERLTLPVSLAPNAPQQNQIEGPSDQQVDFSINQSSVAEAVPVFAEVPHSTEPPVSAPAMTSTPSAVLPPTQGAGSSPAATTLLPEDRQRARAHFEAGCRHYRQREFQQALEKLESASRQAPDEPLYVYLLALTQYQLQETSVAELSVARAAKLEQSAPLSDWGRTMERYQGPARAWLESARRRALKNVVAPE